MYVCIYLPTKALAMNSDTVWRMFVWQVWYCYSGLPFTTYIWHYM